ncbi:hypothetical protein ACWD3I_26050 [Streptomyces sp. NPDC002817]|uniref:hypothetical protein n=1 Tax=Streptomyces sp. NPDC088357 TaxID=3154655 RepID=UPI0034268CC4
MTGSVVTAVEARELREGDLLAVGGTTVTVTGTDHHDLPGMTRIPVSYHPYDTETIRTERWTLPATTRLTPPSSYCGPNASTACCASPAPTATASWSTV